MDEVDERAFEPDGAPKDGWVEVRHPQEIQYGDWLRVKRGGVEFTGPAVNHTLSGVIEMMGPDGDAYTIAPRGVRIERLRYSIDTDADTAVEEIGIEPIERALARAKARAEA